jgi:hypothetical protein
MDLSRRDFVERALLAATTALATGHTPLTAAAEDAAPARKVGPNDKLRVAVIGVNGQGGAHIGEWMKNPDVDLVAICDCDPAAYEKHAKRFKDSKNPPKYQPDVRKLLEDKTIDAVSIATPNHWHALMAVWAMQAGKDVYVEKPCSHNVHEGRVMTQWARKLGRMCQMGVQSRSMTGMRQTLDFIKSGKVGKITSARAICYRSRPSIGLVDTPAPIPTGKQELPKRVVSLGGRLGYVDNGDVANSQISIYQWDDALLISDVRGLPIKTPVTFGLKAGAFKGAANIWFGTDGYVVGPNYSSGVAFDNSGNEIGKWSGGEYQAHFANFVKAIRSRNYKDLHLDIEDGHLSSALAHLGNVSLHCGKAVPGGTRPSEMVDNRHVTETLTSFEEHLKDNNVDFDATKFYLGQVLTIDPKTERSTDEKANQMFSREYRQGFVLPEVG